LISLSSIEVEYSHRSNPLDEVKFAEGRFQAGGEYALTDRLSLDFGYRYYNGNHPNGHKFDMDYPATVSCWA